MSSESGSRASEVSILQASAAVVPVIFTRQPAGRPLGTTDASIFKGKDDKRKAMDLIATKYIMEQENNQGENLPPGTYDRICLEAKAELSYTGHIKKATIIKRVKRKNPVVISCGARSPLELVEPVILEFAVWKQEAGQPITSGDGIELASSLIKGTPTEEDVKSFQKSRHGKDTWILTNNYWQGFMRRHKRQLGLAKGNRVAACRAEWTTYENIAIMYTMVYDQMVNAGVASVLSPADQYWVNQSGDRVGTEAEAYGKKLRLR